MPLGVFRDWGGPAATCWIEQERPLSVLSDATLWWKKFVTKEPIFPAPVLAWDHAPTHSSTICLSQPTFSQLLSMWSTNCVLGILLTATKKEIEAIWHK